MPVYEYACNACRAKVSVFVRSINSEVNAACDRCGSTDMRRLISKVAILRTPANPNDINKQALFDGVDYSDPRSIAQWARNLHGQLGNEMGEEMSEAVERMERGEMSVDDIIGDQHDHAAAFDGGEDL